MYSQQVVPDPRPHGGEREGGGLGPLSARSTGRNKNTAVIFCGRLIRRHDELAISQEIGHKRGPADRRHAVRTVWSQQRTPGFSSLHLPPSLSLPPPFPPSSSPLRCRILRFMLAKGEVEPLCCGGNETESQPDRQPAKHAQRKTSGGKAKAHTSTTAVENKFCSTHVYRYAGYT